MTESCFCVACSTAWDILVSSSITCSLTSRKSPLEPTDDTLGRGRKSEDGIPHWEQPERNGRPRVRGLGPIAPSPPQLHDAHRLLQPKGLQPGSSDTSLRCKLKSPSLKLVTDTPATLSSPMTILGWDFLVSMRITCPLVKRRIREEI